MTQKQFAQVGIDSPLRKTFDYSVPDSFNNLQVGSRVLVPFSRGKVIGIVVALSEHSDLDPKRIKSILSILDNKAIFDQSSFALIKWSARYYHYPLGAALFTALPPALRRGQLDTHSDNEDYAWKLVKSFDENDLRRAPKQLKIVRWLQSQQTAVTITALNTQFPNSHAAIKALVTRGWIEKTTIPNERKLFSEGTLSSDIDLTEEQHSASKHIINALNQFSVLLLEGVTGSGKTEVYFCAISRVLKQDKQAQILILVPEIGLTPQLHSRLIKHFGIGIGLLHSNISEKQRKNTWLKITQGDIQIILGTRLAVFTPIPHLALIIVDEEHDNSLKQQESFLYHARDVAIYRAKQQNIPAVLGSATPSFESLHNAQLGKFKHLYLHQRAHSNVLPRIQLADMRVEKSDCIMSAPLYQAMRSHLQAGQQVILFLNRRGYSPALLCHDCGWVARCQRCDANLTYHSHNNRLICHHCDSTQVKPLACMNCQSSNLIMLGHGTQRIEKVLQQEFAQYSSIRLDKDVTRRKGALEKILEDIQTQKHQIIIGTQILSKGHDFPHVSLVGILDIDYGVHSSDFRALERSAQLLTQVAGRSGRRHTQGEVIVQTHTPDHPLLQTLIKEGYSCFAQQALQSRQNWHLPPFSYHIAIRARGQNNQDVFAFLEKVKTIATHILPSEISIQGPVTAAMEKKAGQYRAYVLLSMNQRGCFTRRIDECLTQIEEINEAKCIRWSVDVDPVDNFV